MKTSGGGLFQKSIKGAEFVLDSVNGYLPQTANAGCFGNDAPLYFSKHHDSDAVGSVHL